jgi:hypothetical protein
LEASSTPLRYQPKIELVVGRQQAVAVVFDDLQFGQPAAERQKTNAGQTAHDEGAAVKYPLPFIDLIEEDRGLVHRNRTSASSNRSIRRFANG